MIPIRKYRTDLNKLNPSEINSHYLVTNSNLRKWRPNRETVPTLGTAILLPITILPLSIIVPEISVNPSTTLKWTSLFSNSMFPVVEAYLLNSSSTLHSFPLRMTNTIPRISSKFGIRIKEIIKGTVKVWCKWCPRSNSSNSNSSITTTKCSTKDTETRMKQDRCRSKPCIRTILISLRWQDLWTICRQDFLP